MYISIQTVLGYTKKSTRIQWEFCNFIMLVYAATLVFDDVNFITNSKNIKNSFLILFMRFPAIPNYIFKY